ncbi:hypothetical protein BDN71DRAFT_1428367 [Pleurotus eryngii]|uniref:Uncharacterized protein n=1 Tax=Pleurotus eryngii TaxID=5323 RepID=A0A9P6A4V9_PLEER|nr:hypothetical protein BDN71DRAFT_1428367 [Pleurotus eryngii]
MTNNNKLPLVHGDMSFIGEHEIQVLANLSLTKAQITELHASIKAAQEQWGISYKDAAHWLYLQKMVKVQAEMAEVERLKAMMMQVQHAPYPSSEIHWMVLQNVEPTCANILHLLL